MDFQKEENQPLSKETSVQVRDTHGTDEQPSCSRNTYEFNYETRITATTLLQQWEIIRNKSESMRIPLKSENPRVAAKHKSDCRRGRGKRRNLNKAQRASRKKRQAKGVQVEKVEKLLKPAVSGYDKKPQPGKPTYMPVPMVKPPNRRERRDAAMNRTPTDRPKRYKKKFPAKDNPALVDRTQIYFQNRHNMYDKDAFVRKCSKCGLPMSGYGVCEKCKR